MAENTLAKLRDWTEPAHPGVIRLYEELIKVYQAMRQRQDRIDAAFDNIARQIGYVVTTTLPVRLEVAADGKVASAQLDAAALRGTLFEHELSPFIKEFAGQTFAGVPQGTYRLYLIWYDALKLKLRRDWIEPAHVLQGLLSSIIGPVAQQTAASQLVRPDVREPAHWFDPGVIIAIEDAVVISAIDEVYPELRLSERIAADRLAIRRIRPEVMEPPHFREFGLKDRDILSEVRALLGKQR